MTITHIDEAWLEPGQARRRRVAGTGLRGVPVPGWSAGAVKPEA